MKNLFKNRIVIGVTIFLAGLIVGWLFFSPSSETVQREEDHAHEAQAEIWTCSMHPSIRQHEPGKCPICGMDLIPLSSDEGDDPMEIKMSETAVKLANIQTITVGAENVSKEIRLNGKVQPDERRVSSQAAHIPGRIEQLLVNFTGEYVQKGAVVAYVYSPELVTAQQELFEAYKIRASQPALYAAAREKLKNWKLTEKQIDGVLTSNKPIERFPINADASGIVLKRNVNVGDYVMRGASIYDVVDLSRVWVLFDVYESDMPWIKKNSTIDFTIQSLPGEKFSGTVSFIDPVIDPNTRVAKARVEMPNQNLALKPEMFASGVVRSNFKANDEIVVPKTAVLWTGERSIVYIKKSSADGISFQLREVLLGPALTDSYVIKQGLESGMEVVTNGAFTIDAAAQLAGKPSMMNPEGGKTTTSHDHGSSSETSMSMSSSLKVSDTFKKQVTEVLDPYIELKDALVASDASAASKAANSLGKALKGVNMKSLDNESHDAWMPLYNSMLASVDAIQKDSDIEKQRKVFAEITDSYFKTINTFNLSGLNAYYEFCPMAFDNKGGYWISKEEEIRNPYFGSKMMGCGEVTQVIK